MNNEEAKSVVQAGIASGLIKTPEPTPITATVVDAPIVSTDVQVTAEKPHEMEQSQFTLIAWGKAKVERLKAEYAELDEAFKIAVKQKWASGALKRHRDKVGREVTYYEKMVAALEAGYILVPNMPGALFVVRTDKVCPTGTWHYSYADAANNKADMLAIGEGDYASAHNIYRTHQNTDSQGKVISERHQAYDFKDIEFPMLLAKPRIMEATTRAMALRIFDEFMILPAEAVRSAGPASSVTRQDPIILGTVIHRVAPYTVKRLSFMVAWHIDTKYL